MNPHEYLNTFTNFETNLHTLSSKEFDLGRIKQLLETLGNPQKGLKVIHVAGTKGKGSTCAFLSYILAAAGYRVGLYTSPHLHRLNERIRILDKAYIESTDDFAGAISDEQLEHVVNEVRGPISKLVERGLFFTYFEVLTAAALYFFSRQNVDFVVLEAGLGGRLDATNAVDSLMAILTPISLDHTKILGETIGAIAREKSGIIKSIQQKVVIAPQSKEAMGVIMQRCAEFGIAPVVADLKAIAKLKVPLKGAHQRTNAAAAFAAVEILRTQRYKISDQAVKTGIAQTQWPGRFEIVQKNPTVILDGAHNVESARALAQTIAQEYPRRKIILVLGFSSDKDVPSIMKEFKNLTDTIILTKADHPRAHVFEGAQSVQEALKTALVKAKSRGVVVVTGSFFVVAEARASLRGNPTKSG